jgi:predicted small secreted protein
MKTLISLIALAGLLALCGCKTVKVVCQDLQKAGEKNEDAAKKK